MGEHEIATDARSWHPVATNPRIVWMSYALLCLVAGSGMVWLVVPGAIRFHELASEKGTESLTASFGLVGLLGCLTFLALLLGMGTTLVAYSFWLLQRIFKTRPSRG